MGCGASTGSDQREDSPHDGSIRLKGIPGANGQIPGSKGPSNRLKNNSVSPAPLAASFGEGEREEEGEGDSLLGWVSPLTRDFCVQVEEGNVHGIKTQSVQTDMNWFPEEDGSLEQSLMHDGSFVRYNPLPQPLQGDIEGTRIEEESTLRMNRYQVMNGAGTSDNIDHPLPPSASASPFPSSSLFVPMRQKCTPNGWSIGIQVDEKQFTSSSAQTIMSFTMKEGSPPRSFYPPGSTPHPMSNTSSTTLSSASSVRSTHDRTNQHHFHHSYHLHNNNNTKHHIHHHQQIRPQSSSHQDMVATAQQEESSRKKSSTSRVTISPVTQIDLLDQIDLDGELNSFSKKDSPPKSIHPVLVNHLVNQVRDGKDGTDSHDRNKDLFDVHLNESLNKLLDDMECEVEKHVERDAYHLHGENKRSNKRDACVQTYNEMDGLDPPIELVPRPPNCRKKEMIPSLHLFKDVDRRAQEDSDRKWPTVRSLVQSLCKDLPNDLQKVRVLFGWIAHNINFDWKSMGQSLSTLTVVNSKEGVTKDFCNLFMDMCTEAGIRSRIIHGFAKGFEHRPGYQFKPGEDVTHSWNAVNLMGSWRLVDVTWGSGYTDHSGKFQRKQNEHFFLPDPEAFIWSHLPYNPSDGQYHQWQLIDQPISLHDFNCMPKVTPQFFEYNLKIRSKLTQPHVFRVQTEVKLGAHEPMRYKYKLYLADEVENTSLNHYAFCQLKEDRLVGSFIVTPPLEGRYFLKIFTKPEREMLEGVAESGSSLQAVVTFLLECTKSRKYLEPYPLNELPWGPTQAFYDYKMKTHNQLGPIISTWGGKRRLVVETAEAMLLTHQMFDSDGMEMDVRTFVLREDNGSKISFIFAPPRVGTFKFTLFGMPKPKQKGKWRLPLLATFLIDCKLAKIPNRTDMDDDPPPLPADTIIPDPNTSRYPHVPSL